MFIRPITTDITPIAGVQRAFHGSEAAPAEEAGIPEAPSFLDVLKNVWNDAVETNTQKTEDIINVMLGNNVDLEKAQVNIAKAEIATELLVNVKNGVVDAYNEIIKMQI